MNDPASTDAPTFAQLLKQLFQQRLHPEGRPYTVAEVALAFPKRAGETHLYKLLSGQIKEPTRPTIRILCRFFQVSPEYFFPELRDVLFRRLPD